MSERSVETLNCGTNEAEVCRANGWGVGTRLVGDEGYGPTVIEITGLGERRILARSLMHNGRRTDYSESSWVLFCRDWTEYTDPIPTWCDAERGRARCDLPAGHGGGRHETQQKAWWPVVPTTEPECERCIDGCDITACHDCGEDYTDPCPRHLAAGHVPSSDAYDDGVDCSTCCLTCPPSSPSGGER